MDAGSPCRKIALHADDSRTGSRGYGAFTLSLSSSLYIILTSFEAQR